MKYLFLLLLAAAVPLHAQTVVLACPGWWGTSDGISTSCTGCSKPIWTVPDADDEVKTDANQYWMKLGTLKSTAKVITNTGKAEGSTANCADSTNIVKTVGELGTSVPNPPPPPTATGNATINWTAPSKNIDGSPLTSITGYRIEYGQTGEFNAQVIVGSSITSYTFVSIATGAWQARIVTLAPAGESAPSNPVTFTVSASAPPAPIDCVVSDWSDWALGTFGACASGTQSRTDTRTRTAVTQAESGGAACPPLTDTRTITQPCSSAPKWTVAPVASDSRPIYEAVLNADGNALVRGNTEGRIASGKPCGDEAFTVGRNSYRTITESNASLDSPTYKGRKHVAICVSN